MEDNYRSILGVGPFPFSLESPQETAHIYSGGKVIVLFSPNINYSVPAFHAHESYEFTIPSNAVVPCKVDNKKMVMESLRLFPFNPEQEHGPLEAMKGINLTGIMFDKDYMQEIAGAMYGNSAVIFQNNNFRLSNDLQTAIMTFIREAKINQPGSRFVLESLALQMAVYLLRNIKSNLPVAMTEHRFAEKQNINRAVDYIIENFDTDYSLNDIAREANLSPYHFIRVFKAETGLTPFDFYLNIKIENACQMLKNKRKTISEIGYECGFSNPSYFTTLFKKKVGVSPSEYRKSFEI